jgi:hypothetical protein
VKIRDCRLDAAKGWYEDLVLPINQSLPVAIPCLPAKNRSTTSPRTGSKLPVVPVRQSDSRPIAMRSRGVDLQDGNLGLAIFRKRRSCEILDL